MRRQEQRLCQARSLAYTYLCVGGRHEDPPSQSRYTSINQSHFEITLNTPTYVGGRREREREVAMKKRTGKRERGRGKGKGETEREK